jgi:hypothetical protein
LRFLKASVNKTAIIFIAKINRMILAITFYSSFIDFGFTVYFLSEIEMALRYKRIKVPVLINVYPCRNTVFAGKAYLNLRYIALVKKALFSWNIEEMALRRRMIWLLLHPPPPLSH